MKKYFLLVLMFITFTMIYSQEVKIFSKDNISFEYPSEWIIRDFPNSYILVTEQPNEQMSVMTTFDVTVDSYSKKITQYCKEYEQKFLTFEQFHEFKIKSKKDIDFKGFDAVEYHCSATTQNLPIEWKSIIFINKEKVYKLSTTSLANQFYLNEATTSKIFSSFKINNYSVKTYDYEFLVLDKKGIPFCYYFQYSLLKNVLLNKEEIHDINYIILWEVRNEAGKYELLNLINDKDTIEPIIEKKIKNKIKGQYELSGLRVVYIGVTDIQKNYLKSRKANLDRVKIVDFDEIND